MIQFFSNISDLQTNVAHRIGAARLFFFKSSLALLFVLFLFCFSCTKDKNNTNESDYFTVILNNDYTGLRTKHAAWLTTADGEVKAASWISGLDSVQLRVPIAKGSVESFDLTVLELSLTTGLISGTDSTFKLTTYQAITNTQVVNLREDNFVKSTNLHIKLQNPSSLDDILVPNAFVFKKPQAATNYEGNYLCYHTGQLWFMLKANGDPVWKYAFLNNVSGSTAEIQIEDVTILPNLFDPPPHTLNFPFSAVWDYDVQAISQLDSLRFLPIGDILRAPGGAKPSLDKVLLYKPKVTNIAKDGYRVNVEGKNDQYTYHIDRFYDQLPTDLPDIPFDLTQSSITDNRTASVQCTGDFDILVFENSYQATNVRANWDAWVTPNIGGQRKYKLPDFPNFVAQTYPYLATYPFTSRGARADNYDLIPTYRTVVEKAAANADPVWRARAKYLSKSIEF